MQMMQLTRKIFSEIFLLFSFSVIHAQVDTVLYQRDSVLDQQNDPTVYFFQHHEKTVSPASVKLITKANKIVSLKDFLTNTGIYADHVLADIDKNGKKELLIWNYTGDAHCCDEIYFFKNIAPNKYQFAARTFAGNVIVNEDNNFIYDFSEQFGYFFTCYACAYDDSTGSQIDAIHTIDLRYKNGKLVVEDMGPERLRAIRDKLGRLSERPYHKLASEIDQDDGLRKEFAMNLSVYHYSYAKRNIATTKLLFDKYYKFPDAKKVWAAFVKQLQEMKKDNDF
jgi:hypothetical protein